MRINILLSQLSLPNRPILILCKNTCKKLFLKHIYLWVTRDLIIKVLYEKKKVFPIKPGPG